MHAGEWLLDTYAGGKFCGAYQPGPIEVEKAECLSNQLIKAASRRRPSATFTILVEKSLATWFGAMSDTATVFYSVSRIPAVPQSVYDAMLLFKLAASKVRGRNRLSAADVDARAESVVKHLDPRHRKRMARLARYNKAFAEWSARGNTIAGSAGTDDLGPKKVT